MRPSDIPADWYNAIRSAISSCSGNDGYAVIKLTIAVNGNRPIMYYPEITRIQPRKMAAGVKVTPEVAAALSGIMKSSNGSD